MGRERIVSSDEQVADAEQAVGAVRPRRIDEYVGQRELVERLRIALQAAKERNEPMEHVLLHGPPGLGKTTLAHVIAAEMGTRAYVTSGPALTRAADLMGMLTKMEAHDVLFIDEIHRLPVAVEEYIYPAMEDFRIDFTVDSGMHARVVTMTLKPFTLIGATTRAGLLTQALRTRFGVSHNLTFYPQDDLVAILDRAAGLLRIPDIRGEGLRTLAARSRGTPRVALRLLRRVRDF
ncbi:MAG: Holliday junction branch migration DNA helicase RuvB, partial [Phycisphaerae bacterium]|nr:Holliday junction branch migration DNA helicase RuvB [Phycisphaerae bacterium]